MKNILMINHDNFEKGGASMSLFNLACQLNSKGFNVYVVVTGKGNLQNMLLEKNINCIKMNYFWWQYPIRFNLIKRVLYKLLRIFNLKSLYSLKRFCKKNAIDTIHSNSSVIDIGMVLSNKTKLPHYWHFREFGEQDLQLEYIYGRDKSIKRINSSNSNVLMISKSIMNSYSDINNTFLCYNGVGDENINERTHSYDFYNILISGRVTTNKGQLFVIKALKDLINQDINNFHLYLYGYTLDLPYMNEINEYISKNNLSDYVSIQGFNSNMPDVRKKMDIEIVSSKCEAFGRVIIESMKSSCLVIGSNTGACPELIDNHKNGLIYKQDDIKSLSNVLKSVLEKHVDINILSRQAYLDTKNNFTVKTNCESFINIIENNGEYDNV